MTMQHLRRTLTHCLQATLLLGTLALLLAWAGSGVPRLAPFAALADALRFQGGLLLLACAALLGLLQAWRSAGLGGLLVLWALLPAVTWPDGPAPTDRNGIALRVLSVNLGGPGARPQRVLAELRTARPDVLLLQEYTPQTRAQLRAALMTSLPHVHERARVDDFGMAVFARVPWTQIDDLTLGGTGTPQVRIVLPLGQATLVLYGIHLLPPRWGQYERHRAEFDDLLRRCAGETQPTALAGDFNFVDHGVLASTLHEHGFFDVHGIAGEGRGATWPAHGRLRHVPGIRIDHVYVGRGLSCAYAWVGGSTGSDHRPVGCVVTRATR